MSFGAVFGQSDQARIMEKSIEYKDWTYKGVMDGSEINLRQLTADKKLVLLVYFAPWCHNSKNQAPFVEQLYKKYKDQGLAVIGIGEYGAVEDIKNMLDFFKATYPVVYESESRDDKEKTHHFEYRKATGDTRGWGTPWNIFIEPANFKKKGNPLVKTASTISGELIEYDTENFVRQKLGLPALPPKPETAKTPEKKIEACDPEKKPGIEFKKP